MSVKYAVLGHLVRHPDYGYRLRAELAEQLEMPDLSKNTVYRALEQLEGDGLIAVAHTDRGPGAGRDRVWYEATETGSEAFEAWLRGAAEEPVPIDALHSKLLASRPANLPELIELTWARERACLARLGELEGAEEMPVGEWRRSWEGVTGVLVRNNQIAHLQTTVSQIQRARDVLMRLRDDPNWPERPRSV
jgi:DNA-binding PadR family transcriptional regulator